MITPSSPMRSWRLSELRSGGLSARCATRPRGTVLSSRSLCRGRNPSTVGSFVRILRDAGLNQEIREKQTVGYYEGLLNEGSRVSSMGSLLTGQIGRPSASATRNIRALRQTDK